MQDGETCKTEPKRRDLSAEIGYKKLRRALGKELSEMHLHKKVPVATCVMAVKLAEQAAAITVDACRRAVASAGATADVQQEVAAVDKRVAAVLQELRDINKVCEAEAPDALLPVVRPLLAPGGASKKHFAFFSLKDVAADVMQKDAEARRHICSSSDDWSTGRFRTPPSVVTDIVHAQRFRESPASRPATAAELAGPKRYRIAVQAWNDDATVSDSHPPMPGTQTHGSLVAESPTAWRPASLPHSILAWQWVKCIGVRRKLHKYGVIVCRIVNLPPQLRNRPNSLLVIGLYNTKFAKANGGVCRMIGGVGPDGKEYDEVCLRTDLEALRHGIPMEVSASTVKRVGKGDWEVRGWGMGNGGWVSGEPIGIGRWLLTTAHHPAGRYPTM